MKRHAAVAVFLAVLFELERRQRAHLLALAYGWERTWALHRQGGELK